MGRFLELIAAAGGIVLLSPVFIMIAVLVKLHDGGMVLHRAQRVGRDGKLFGVCKFRTMIPNAHKRGAGVTVRGDSRVTSAGKFLRKYKLDELPQLFNVLKGEMSFVGPRPEDPRYVEHYTPEQRMVLAVPPGITSPASLHFRNEEALLGGHDWEKTYLEQILPRKLAMELEYFPSRSIGGDFRIIIRTLGGILR